MATNTRKDEELREAFRCIVSLAYARPENNKTTCSVYMKEPGELRGEGQEEQVSATAIRVKNYLQSWVIPVLEEHLGLNEEVTREIMERQANERSAIIAKLHADCK